MEKTSVRPEEAGNATQAEAGNSCQLTIMDPMRILFVIAFVTLAIQIVRIAYQGWFGIQESVVAEYESASGQEDLTRLSLAELAKRYDVARKAVEAFENDESNQAVIEEKQENPEELLEMEPWVTERRLGDAIEARERDQKVLREIHYYCILGICLVLAGTLCFTRFNGLIGMSLLISGFIQTIFHAAPNYLRDPENYSTRAPLLVYSAVAMALLLFSARVTGTLSPDLEER